MPIPRTLPELHDWQRSALKRMERDDSPNVLVTGAAGCGKTTLVDTFTRRKMDESGNVVFGFDAREVTDRLFSTGEWANFLVSFDVVVIDEFNVLSDGQIGSFAGLFLSNPPGLPQIVVAATPRSHAIDHLDRHFEIVGPEVVVR